jgi:hypothetical protein
MRSIKQLIAVNGDFLKLPKHQIFIGVKIVPFKGTDRRFLRRFQFTALHVATGLRALWIYPNLTSDNAARFFVRAQSFYSKLGVEVESVCTANLFIFRNGAFSRQCSKLEVAHLVDQETSTNNLVEICHRIDDNEFYRFLELERLDDRALLAKLQIWQYRYNCHRFIPHCRMESASTQWPLQRHVCG